MGTGAKFDEIGRTQVWGGLRTRLAAKKTLYQIALREVRLAIHNGEDWMGGATELRPMQPGHYFVWANGAEGTAVAGGALRLSETDFGSLSACATSKLTCHICVSLNASRKPGIPVRRIPLATFQ